MVEDTSQQQQQQQLEVDFDKNITNLYSAITESDWDTALSAAVSAPEEAKTWVVRKYEDSDDIMWRFLPLHSACARQPPSNVIQALLSAYPEAAHAKDDQGMFALHYACGNQASRDVIRQLLVANPQAAKMADPRGMIPIHYLACWGPSSVSIIDMLLVAHRDVGSVTDIDGNTPLSLAMEGEYPERDAVVAALQRWLNHSSGKVHSKHTIASAVASVSHGSPSLSASGKSTTSSTHLSNLSMNSTEEPPVEVSYESPKKTSIASKENNEEEVETPKAGTTKSMLEPLQTSAAIGNSNTYSESQSDSQITIGRLRKEVTTLKQEKSSVEAKCNALDAENRVLSEQMESYRSKIKALESKNAALETTNSVLSEQTSSAVTNVNEYKARIEQLERLLVEKTDLGDKAASELAKAHKVLYDIEEERDDLRQTLYDLTASHDKHKHKADMLSDRLGSLSASLMSMMDEQSKLMAMVQDRDARLAQQSASRRAKLQMIMDMEDEYLSNSIEKSGCDDTMTGGDASSVLTSNSIEHMFDRQTKEMDAIASVITAMRS